MTLLGPFVSTVVPWLVVGVYGLALVWMLIFCGMQARLAWFYARDKKNSPQTPPPSPKAWPRVTIQLPIYNELYVVERLLEAVTQIDYPHPKLEIQVLDDSTDETATVLQQQVAHYQKMGHNIHYLHRSDRVDFKAGALRAGLTHATGELIAIFDADFLPPKDWLRQTVPYFEEAQLGLLQTRWGHLNADYSLLTRVQAFALDIHFTIEQKGRNLRHHFINFNGTAGIWRKACIEEAGNWQGDTLTEDLDLSYRAQLKGWRFRYLESVVAPAEIPMTVEAIRSQQFRWNKGGAENFQKLIAALWRNPKTSIRTKIYGSFHLLSSSMFVPVFLISLLSLPMLYLKSNHPAWASWYPLTAFFWLGALLLYVSYWQFYKHDPTQKQSSRGRYTQTFFWFYTVVMGFAAHNTRAVWQGHRRIKTPFVRTVKFNKTISKKGGVVNKYLGQQTFTALWLEVIMALYMLAGVYTCLTLGKGIDYGVLPFYLLVFMGYATVLYYGWSSSKRQKP